MIKLNFEGILGIVCCHLQLIFKSQPMSIESIPDL
jgi:hypothetical protein